jgi:hypothetical protein
MSKCWRNIWSTTPVAGLEAIGRKARRKAGFTKLITPRCTDRLRNPIGCGHAPLPGSGKLTPRFG